MNEPTLYRIDHSKDDELPPDTIHAIVETGWLVPVERCEDGLLDPHPCTFMEHGRQGWCPGAGIGGGDE